MYIILRLVCQTFKRIAIKISFLWGHKHGVYATALFSVNVTSWCSRNDKHSFTSVILYINIIFIAQWLRCVTILHDCRPFIYKNILFVLHLESCTFKHKPLILFSLFTFYNILQLIDMHNWGYYNNAFWWTQAAANLTVNADRYILTCISYYPDTINFFQLGWR